MQSLVEISPVVLDKKIFKSCHIISLFCNYHSLGKGNGPAFEEEFENSKSLQPDRQTDDG